MAGATAGCIHLTPGSQSSLGPFANPGGNRNLPNMEVCRDPRLYRCGPLVAAFAGHDAAQTAEFIRHQFRPGAGLTPAASTKRGLRTGIVNLTARGMLVVSVARRLGSEGPLLAYCAARSNRAGPQKGALGAYSDDVGRAFRLKSATHSD